MGEPTFKQLLKNISSKPDHSLPENKKKRANKHAPKEISSKIPASRFKPIKFYQQGEDPESGKFIKKFKPRDPRFESFSGTFNKDLFEKSYSFVDEIRTRELEELKEALKNPDYENSKEELKRLYMKKKHEIQRLKDESRQNRIKRELVKEEKEKVKTGKKPFFFKKGVIKMMAMKEKIEEMKESGEFNEYRRKKRKRQMYEDKFAPNQIPRKRREV